MLQPSVKSAAARAVSAVRTAERLLRRCGYHRERCFLTAVSFQASPASPRLFFNKQYVRGNTESPEIGVEVRNVSFKFSLTSASLRRALRRGARLCPPTSQRSTRVRRDDEKSWASPRCFGARGNSWCSGWTFEGIIWVHCKWNCFKYVDSTTGTMTRNPVLTWSGTSPRENQSRAMFVAWVAKPALTETHHHAYKATFIPIRELAHAPADIASLTVPT